MNPDYLKAEWIASFQSGTTTIEVSKKDFELCFPDTESLFTFLDTYHLHLHANAADWPGVFALSVDDEKPWG